MRSLPSVGVAALLVSALLFSASPVVARSNQAVAPDARASSQNVNLGSALSADGTFVGNPSLQGSVDMSDWELTSDLSKGDAPRFERHGESSVLATTANGWSNLGSNGSGNGALNSFVYGAAIYGTDLYVGGNFYQGLPNSTSLDFLAKWNGTAWSSVGSNGSGGPAVNGAVYTLYVWNGNLLIGGDFTNAGGDQQADELAVWNNSNFTDIANASSGVDPFNFGEVHAISGYGPDLYIGGYWFNSPATPFTGPNAGDNILRWNGSWNTLGQRSTGDGAIQATVFALVANSTGVVAGGQFSATADDITTKYLAEYNLATNTWSDVHSSANDINGEVHALFQSGNNLYVGGDFTDAFGMTPADYFIQWNGSQWIAPGGGNSESAIKARVHTIVGSGSNVYVGGNFINVGVGANAIPTGDRLAKWNGTSWSSLGSNGTGDGALNTSGAEPPGWVRAIALTSTTLYAGGSFRDAGNVPEADYIAAYGLSAAGKQKPDGRIKKGSGTLVGNNIYNTSGLNQTRSGSATVNKTITFTVSIQNDGTGAGKFGVAATASGNVNFQVSYFHGTTNVTAAVVAGTYTTAKVGVGNTFSVTVKVFVAPAVNVGSPTNRLITITSTTDPSKVDAVKLTATRT